MLGAWYTFFATKDQREAYKLEPVVSPPDDSGDTSILLGMWYLYTWWPCLLPECNGNEGRVEGWCHSNTAEVVVWK